MSEDGAANSRRRNSVSLEVDVIAFSFFTKLRKFIIESGGYSLCGSVMPLVVVVMVLRLGTATTDKYYGPSRTSVPPVIENVTAVSFDLYGR